MLWPLADRPRLAPGVPGGTVPVRLVDDDLANSLAGEADSIGCCPPPSSRPAAPSTPTARRPRDVPRRLPGPPRDRKRDVRRLRRSLTRQHRSAAGHPHSPRYRPSRRDDCLSRLRALAHRLCVAPTPYAQADLDALQRVRRSRPPRHRDQRRRRRRRPHPRTSTPPAAPPCSPDSPLTGRAPRPAQPQDKTVAIARGRLTPRSAVRAPGERRNHAAPADTASGGGAVRPSRRGRVRRPQAPLPARRFTWTLRC